MSPPSRAGVPTLPFLLAYPALTIAGLFAFRGIPVLNIALGFPLGAVVALRRAEAGRNPGALRDVLWWASFTAAITMLLCWLELAMALAVLKAAGGPAIGWRWIPLLPPPASSELVRLQFFAVVIAPLIQVLTTSFGGMLALVLRSQAPRAGG
ncbi:MAG: hypothetical protein FJY75_09150 [Candidatus Eisenbacteria bacterium]|uniref:Uncharacterized protein n=1 Tax=Eiseniibacteriota bacterium TaxID=2212470 RepID=A0A937XBL3_UNCEI|nr:hypothetical protein [Candidatus Eisenbacteria bacterium]